MDDRELLRALDGLEHPRILIVGDLILDRYVTGEVERISPEAPIPVLNARHTHVALGGAGNVAANLRAMKAEVEICGVVGEDDRGASMIELLESIDVGTAGLIRTNERPTTEKSRMISGVQQLVRIDWEAARPVSEETARRILAELPERIERASAVVLSDYGKGVLTDEVIHGTIGAARRSGLPVLVDPKGTDFRRYRGATLVTPNRKEAELALGRKLDRLEDLPGAAREVMEQADLEAAVITLGHEGIYYRSSQAEGRVPTMARSVFDVSGAGDTVIANLALGLAGGLDLETAVRLANHAAGIVVGRAGVASATRDEVRASLGARRGLTGAILEREELPLLLAEWRAEGKRIVFTNGCFDLLHAGHIAYLRAARARGDVLIVGVNDDESVARLKGPDRPVNPLEDRLTVLAALEMVDAVVSFGEDTPKEIVEEITPNVLVKGQDWEDQGVVGREWVEKHGGEVFLAPLLPGRSTTSMVARLRNANESRAST